MNGYSRRLERLEAEYQAAEPEERLSPAEERRQSPEYQALLVELLETMDLAHVDRLAAVEWHDGECSDPEAAHLRGLVLHLADLAADYPGQYRPTLPPGVAEVCMVQRAYLHWQCPSCQLSLPWCRSYRMSQDGRQFEVVGRYFDHCPACGFLLAGRRSAWQQARGVEVVEVPV